MADDEYPTIEDNPDDTEGDDENAGLPEGILDGVGEDEE